MLAAVVSGLKCYWRPSPVPGVAGFDKEDADINGNGPFDGNGFAMLLTKKDLP